jgi:hypothetical protein
MYLVLSVVRLMIDDELRSRFVDSLADQIYRAVYYTLVTTQNSLFDINRSIDRVFNITVNREHPLAARLAAEAGVTEDRFERPVFNYWREHHLVHRHELDQAFQGVWNYVPWVDAPPFFQNGWIHDRSWWFELWSELLSKPVQMVARLDGSVPLEEASTISFNSGPHWTSIELFPAQTRRLVRSEDLLRGWIGAVSDLREKRQTLNSHCVVERIIGFSSGMLAILCS